MYFALAGTMENFRHLHFGLSLVLIFVGGKMLLSRYWQIPTGVTIAVITGLLLASVLTSVIRPAKEK
jgi:tellurite resistance protein TerC